VEVALKMALGFWFHRRAPRSRILVMEHSYHGDTVGTMSVSARGPFTGSFEPLLFDVSTIPFPFPGRESHSLAVLEDYCARSDAAALLVEPLVLGAGGMLMYPAEQLALMKRVCERHGVLLIVDEVMTGWGRTGTRFACEQAGISPDILCSSKGLTGGFLPLAVTLCREEIYEAHYSTERSRTFFHSSSFTGNPLACAAALANMEVWETEPVQERIDQLSRLQGERLERFRGDARVTNLRQTGTITALDVNTPSTGYLSTIGPRLHQRFLDANVLLRPLGNTLYVLPPYCVTAPELDQIYEAILGALDSLGSDLTSQ
jgi:adenosylmethionine-8-amino-7-oxononanoate aminotransferase